MGRVVASRSKYAGTQRERVRTTGSGRRKKKRVRGITGSFGRDEFPGGGGTTEVRSDRGAREDKRERTRDEERNRFNKCNGRRHRADDDGGVAERRGERDGEAGREVRSCERERERDTTRATGASRTERQQTHACATWSERSNSGENDEV